MARLDALDMSVFQFGVGSRWAKNLLDGEMYARTFESYGHWFPKLSLVETDPRRLNSWTVDWRGGKRPAIDAFLDILSAAPQEMMDRYGTLRGLARRFGSGANDWLNRKETSVASFERRLGNPREPRPVRVPIYDRLMANDSVVVFTVASDIATRMFEAAEKLKAQVAVPVSVDPEAGLAVAGLDDFRLPADLVMDYHAQVPWALPFSLFYADQESAPRARLRRDLAGFSAFKYLEPYARAVDVQRDYVNVDLDREPRPADQPLFYKQSIGNRSSRLDDHDEFHGDVQRVEARVATGMSVGDVTGIVADVARQHETSARIYIEGSLGKGEAHQFQAGSMGSPFGFEPGVVDLVSRGPGAQAALFSAFTALGGMKPK